MVSLLDFCCTYYLVRIKYAVTLAQHTVSWISVPHAFVMNCLHNTLCKKLYVKHNAIECPWMFWTESFTTAIHVFEDRIRSLFISHLPQHITTRCQTTFPTLGQLVPQLMTQTLIWKYPIFARKRLFLILRIHNIIDRQYNFDASCKHSPERLKIHTSLYL
jgi:hypothetical protein